MAPVSFKPAPEGTRAWAFPKHLSPTTPAKISESSLTLQTVGKTDWWRTTYEWRSTGPSYLFPLAEDEKRVLDKEASEELVTAVKLDGRWEVQFDQAALFLHFSDQLWVKTGIEYTEGKAWVSVVVTNRWSDWSVRPLPVPANAPLRFEIRLQGHHLRVFLGDEMLREVNGFAADVTPEERQNVSLGVMGCSPIGDGTEVVFHDFELSVGQPKGAH